VIPKGAEVWVVVSIGLFKSKEPIVARYREQYECYKWKDKKVECEQLVDMELPFDFAQIPDIFIDFYTNTTFSGEERFGYLRLKAKDCVSLKPKPNWFRLTTPYNDIGTKSVGSVMANV
jgi:hypothetical protein